MRRFTDRGTRRVAVCASCLAACAAGGTIWATAGSGSSKPHAAGATAPDTFPELRRPQTARDRLTESTNDPSLDRSSARRLNGLPAGWDAWVATSKLPDGGPAVCVLWAAPDRPPQEGLTSVCDTPKTVQGRGLAGFSYRNEGDPITLLSVTPPDVGVSVRGARTLSKRAFAAGTDESRVLLVRGAIR